MSAFKTVVSEAVRGAVNGGGSRGRRRDGRAWRGTLWLLAAAIVLPFGLVLPLAEVARARAGTRRRSRDFYSN